MTLFAELNCTKIFSKISRKFEKMFCVSLIIGDDFSLTQIIQPIVTARGRCEKLTLGQTAKKKIVEMFQVKSFLGCCQLETGGIILGWFFFCTFLLATTIVFVYGSMLIVAGRKFWCSCAEIWHKFVKRFAFSSSTLYADLAWCHYFLDYCHLCVVVNDSRNQNCELRHYIESIRKNPTVSFSILEKPQQNSTVQVHLHCSDLFVYHWLDLLCMQDQLQKASARKWTRNIWYHRTRFQGFENYC